MTITVVTLSILVFAALMHFFADFVLQNEWMANNKHNVKHPAGYVHAVIMTLPMLLLFPLWASLVIGVSHFLIDTRIPIQAWMNLMRNNLPNEPWFFYVAITIDQIWHVTILAILALICGGSI